MPATKTATGKTRSRSKRKTKEERAEINRQNSRLSTGPRTAEGKRNSKFNARTHGMTARTVLLPGEDAGALAARQQHLVDSFQPRNSVELAVIEGMAGDMWKSDRVELAAGLRISMRLRHEPLEQEKKEQDEAVELGGRLFWQPSFPLPISKRFPIGKLTEPLCSENAVHPHHPARIKLRLEQTISGCDWLIDSWGDLMQRLYRDELWLSADPFKMVRLLGKHAIDMVDDLTVARVFLCSLTLMSAPKAGPNPDTFDWQSAMIKMLITFDVENKRGIAASVVKQCEPFARRLAELPLAKLAPQDEEQARGRLTAIIDQEVCRLRHVRQTLQAIADADAAEAPGRLAFEIGPEGDRHRRYGLSAERLVIKRFGDFLTTRGKSAEGTFDPVDVDLHSLLGTAVPHLEASDGDGQFAAAPPHPACGRPLPDGRSEGDAPSLASPSHPACGRLLPDGPGEEDALSSAAPPHPARGRLLPEGRGDEVSESLASPPHPACGRPLPEGRAGDQDNRVFPRHGSNDTPDRPCLDRPASSPEEQISCDDKYILRNEAIAHGNDPLNDIERRRREFEKWSPFRAERPRKSTLRERRETEAALEAIHSLRGGHDNTDPRSPPTSHVEHAD